MLPWPCLSTNGGIDSFGAHKVWCQHECHCMRWLSGQNLFEPARQLIQLLVLNTATFHHINPDDDSSIVAEDVGQKLMGLMDAKG